MSLKDQFRYFRAQQIVKNVGSAKKHKNLHIDPDQKYKILIVAYDAIGDFIISTPTFNFLKKHFYNSEFDLICSHRNYELARNLNLFNNLFPLRLNSNIYNFKQWKEIKFIRNLNYDYIINLFDEPDECAIAKILSLTNDSTKIISLPIRYKSRLQQKILTHQNILITSHQQSKHFADRVLDICNILGLPSGSSNVKYSFPFTDTQIDLPENKINVLFNPFGSQKNNTLSDKNTVSIINILKEIPNVNIHLFDHKYFKELKIDNIIVHKTESIIKAGDILKQMNLVITTDTSISHIATAAEKKLVVIRSNENWREKFDPYYGDYEVIKSRSHDINDIDLKFIQSIISKKIGAIND